MSVPRAYYNEINPRAAAVLRELIVLDIIAPGEVDERSIEDVVPTDLSGFTQHHFFAGVGVWSYALRQAGWPDSRPVWTGSCPCPPFSVAGKKKACPECGGKKPLPHAFRTGVFRCTACGHDWHADGRHLWPDFHRLIKERRPGVVFGEQVGGRNGQAWGDIVQATLELEGYAVGRVPFAACGVGSPQIRQRLYWVADTTGCGQQQFQDEQPAEICGAALGAQKQVQQPCADGTSALRMGDTIVAGLEGHAGNGDGTSGREESSGSASKTGASGGMAYAALRWESGRIRECGSPEWPAGKTGGHSAVSRLEHPGGIGWERRQAPAPGYHDVGPTPQRQEGQYGAGRAGTPGIFGDSPGPVNGHWQNVDWLLCRDGFYRPVESLDEPLADGLADRLGYRRIGGGYALDPIKEKAENRVMRLEAYGNAIVAPQAVEFIRAYMETEAIAEDMKT